MKCSKQEFLTFVYGPLRAAYSSANIMPDSLSIDTWYTCLGDIEADALKASVISYIMNEHFPPTIADIRKGCTVPVVSLNSSEAWGLVLRAIKNSSYNSVKEFDALPEDAQAAVGSPDNLREWAIDENINLSVLESNFRRTYENVIRQKNEYGKLPEVITRQIEARRQAVLDRAERERRNALTDYTNAQLNQLSIEALERGADPERVHQMVEGLRKKFNSKEGY